MKDQPLFDLMMDEHGVTLLETDMQEIVNTVKIIYQPKLIDRVNSAMAHLMKAHDKLIKSGLSDAEYKPIEIELNYAKIILTEIKA